MSADYAPAVIPLAFDWTGSGVLGALLLLGTLGLALRLWGTQTLGADRNPPRLFSFGVLWLVITLSPVSNVLFLSGVLLAERTFYLPSVGFVALLAWVGVELHKERRRVAKGALILVLMLMSLRTVTRNATWRNNSSVFDTLMREHPESGRAQWLLGDAQQMVGNRKAGNKAYRITISLLNGSYPVLVDVARRLLVNGQTGAAKALLLPLSANVRETRSTQRIRVGRRQRKRTCRDCEREWKRMVMPLEPGRPSEARQLLRTRRW